MFCLKSQPFYTGFNCITVSKLHSKNYALYVKTAQSRLTDYKLPDESHPLLAALRCYTNAWLDCPITLYSYSTATSKWLIDLKALKEHICKVTKPDIVEYLPGLKIAFEARNWTNKS